MKIKKKNLKIVAIVLLSLLTFGIVFGNANSWIANEDGKVKVYSLYESGTIDDKGDNLEMDSRIRTKNKFLCKGLEVKVNGKDPVAYTLCFYDESSRLLGRVVFTASMCLEDLQSHTNVTYYDKIHSVRIVIVSPDESDISLLDYWDYIKRIDVYVDADQD